MRARTALVASLVLVAAAGSLSSATAAPKPKPITKSYTATAFPPSPTNVQLGVCNGDVPGSNFDTEFKAPFAGRLTVDMTGFQGDWDMALVQDGANAQESAQDIDAPIDTPEHIDGYKLKKGEAITIRNCNFLGGPTASVKYTFKAL
jgi:hypothetical protein